MDILILPPGISDNATPLYVERVKAHVGMVSLLNPKFTTTKYEGKSIPKITGDVNDMMRQKRMPVKGMFKSGFIKPTGHIVDEENQIIKSARAAYIVGRRVFYV